MRISKRVFQGKKHVKFSEKRTFFTPWYAHIFVFFGKFDVLYFLGTPVLRFALLLYYRWCFSCLWTYHLSLQEFFGKKYPSLFPYFYRCTRFFYSFFLTNVLIIADENTHAFDGILFFSLILCFFQSSYYTSSIFFIKR